MDVWLVAFEVWALANDEVVFVAWLPHFVISPTIKTLITSHEVDWLATAEVKISTGLRKGRNFILKFSN